METTDLTAIRQFALEKCSQRCIVHFVLGTFCHEVNAVAQINTQIAPNHLDCAHG